MKIIRFQKTAFSPGKIEGNLALKSEPVLRRENVLKQEPVLKNYQKPKALKLVLKPQVKKDTRVFMGCYQFSWPANDGDGC